MSSAGPGILWSVMPIELVLEGLAPATPARADVDGPRLSVERQPDGTRRALVQNPLAGPVQVRVWDPARPEGVVEALLEAGESRAIGRFPGSGGIELRLHARPGAPLPLPPTQTRPYAFPLPADAAWRLTQGFGGRASHRDPANWHALDFAAAHGTPVLAARAGTVMQVVDGFTEGDRLSRGDVDVVVTDGFSGNIALKTAEGTAHQLASYLRAAMNRTWASRLGYLLARGAFQTLREKMDPRKANGGVFLGLNGVVIKSHGGADAEGTAAAIDMGYDMVRYKLLAKIGQSMERDLQATTTARLASGAAS